ncbi:glycosyltransferase family 9 protein [Halomonas nitroreducens]|uniref:Lipopolysaccharide heptosyltransferase family protein n=1 Tax=Halomonas nitroreducens TaxID=447425 RepID=A0A431V7V1_9GAMM|nr:glycosyltransferase family 9 protein [Halomonas nitroreducens]RTR05627.1 lipopolysaccharide heptosyltransferase family protein [Halomonas nitroreducens]
MTSFSAQRPPRILVVRNDKLGDFMLAWPALAALKAATPAPHVSVLVPDYTAPLARCCPWVDEVILDPGDSGDRGHQQELLVQLKSAGFDALLTLFSTPRVGWLGWRAGIPLRLAPATKWAQLFYNRRVPQRRSRSAKPEYVYNLELAEALLASLDLERPPRPAPPYWPLSGAERTAQRAAIAATLGLEAERPWLFLHAGSGGSAVNLTSAAYARLACDVDARLRARGKAPAWVLTAGPGEESHAEALAATLRKAGLAAHRLPPSPGLEAFAHSLAAADLFIAGSTGPLHIAACLNRPTAGFYPSRRSATPLRWQTCNSEDRRLAFCPPGDAHEADMTAIDLNDAAARIARQLQPSPTSEPHL